MRQNPWSEDVYSNASCRRSILLWILYNIICNGTNVDFASSPDTLKMARLAARVQVIRSSHPVVGHQDSPRLHVIRDLDVQIEDGGSCHRLHEGGAAEHIELFLHKSKRRSALQSESDQMDRLHSKLRSQHFWVSADAMNSSSESPMEMTLHSP